MGGWAEDHACADPRARTPIGASRNLYFPWRSRDIAACKSMCSCAAAVVFSFALLSSVTFKIGFYLSFHLHSCRFSRFSALPSVTFSGEIFTCLCFHYVLSQSIQSSVILISFLLCSLSEFFLIVFLCCLTVYSFYFLHFILLQLFSIWSLICSSCFRSSSLTSI